MYNKILAQLIAFFLTPVMHWASMLVIMTLVFGRFKALFFLLKYKHKHTHHINGTYSKRMPHLGPHVV